MAVRRVNDSLLGPLERVTLAWSASRLPAWVLPDHLTLLGLIGALLTGAHRAGDDAFVAQGLGEHS